VTWTVQFYNDLFLSGEVMASRTDTAPVLAYNWGVGAPAANVKPNQFGGRWGTDIHFAAGTYRFTVQADDVARVFVDFEQILDTIDNPLSGQALSADVTLSAGSHHLQVDYVDFGGDAYLYFSWENVAELPPIASTNGLWIAQYYDNASLRGEPVFTQWEASPEHYWGADNPARGVPRDNFSVRWTGIQDLRAGSYQFKLSADDGVRLYVDDLSRINEFHTATNQTYEAITTLGTGLHSIVIEFYDAGEIAFVDYTQYPLDPPATPPGLAGTVTTTLLNVRSAPDLLNSALVMRANQGESYPVIGQDIVNGWWLIVANGTTGWVKPEYFEVGSPVIIPNVASTAPESDCSTDTGLVAGGRGTLPAGADTALWNIPAFGIQMVGDLPSDADFEVLAGPVCVGTIGWWLVKSGEVMGWTMGR
jgi:hypothetical protein